MIVTSDNTELSAINTATKTGSSTRTNWAAAIPLGGSRPPMNRPISTNTRTGRTIDPNAPSGSRRKILISIQVSFQSPCSMALSVLVANRMAGQCEEDVLQVRQHGAEVGDPDPILGQTMDYLAHEVVPQPLNCELRAVAHHGLHLWDRAQAFFGERIVGGQDDGLRGAMTAHQLLRPANVDDLSMLDDCHAVAQALGLLHQMSGHENCFAAVADAAHQVPNRPTRLGVEPGGQLVQKHYFRIVDQSQGDEQPLFLSTRQGDEPGVPFVGKAELFEQASGVHRLRVERSPEIHRLPHLDSLLELRLLELHPNPVLHLIHVAERIQA